MLRRAWSRKPLSAHYSSAAASAIPATRNGSSNWEECSRPAVGMRWVASCVVAHEVIAPGTLLDFEENPKLDASVESQVSKTARPGAPQSLFCPDNNRCDISPARWGPPAHVCVVHCFSRTDVSLGM